MKTEAEPKERIMTVLKLTKELGLTEAGIKVSEDTDSSEQRSAGIRQGITWLLACYKEILKNKKRFSSRRTWVLDLFKSFSGNRALSSVLFHSGDDDPVFLP